MKTLILLLMTVAGWGQGIAVTNTLPVYEGYTATNLIMTNLTPIYFGFTTNVVGTMLPTSLAYAEWQIKTMCENGSLTNVINLLISKGVFCEVRGHKWEPCLTIHYGPIRHCPICGHIQTQAIGEWK